MKIQQGSTFLLTMVQRVSSGSLAPAEFQRPYVWTREDVLALCTSILERYPIVGFLSWSPGAHADVSTLARHRLGPIELRSDAKWPALLLDGQNRLASLAWMLKDKATPLPVDLSENERVTWATDEELILDLATNQFQFVPSSEAHTGLRLPAAAVFDSRVANTIVRARWNNEWSSFSEAARDDALRCLDVCADAFRDARVVETVLEDATPAEARKAFLHICRVGVPISQSDFDSAIGWST